MRWCGLRSSYTNHGNWEDLYGMAYLDSNSDVEPIVGYGYEWVNARARFAQYFPIPGVLPLASVGYNQMKLNSIYVSGAHGCI